MKYNPEDANAHLIQGDVWLEATIVSAEDKVSKAGNEMIEAGFKVYDDDGTQPTISDYYVSSKPGKFKKLCSVLGLNFESGEVAAHELIGKSLDVFVKIQKDETGKYGDKNVIAAFAPRGEKSKAQTQDDGIPF